MSIRLVLLLSLVVAAAPASAQEGPEEIKTEPEQYTPPPPTPPPSPELRLAAPPPVIYIEERRWGLFAIGAGVFGGAFVGTLIDSLNSNQFLGLVPLVGPFLLLSHDNGAGTNVLLALDGAAEIAGVTLAILGVALKKRVPVYALVPTGNGVAFAGIW